MRKLKKFVKRIVFGAKADSESYVKYLRNMRMPVGDNTRFIDPRATTIDITRPWLIRIGSGCTITPGVTIMTHDYTLPVLREVYGEVLASGAGSVTVGDNVYIGMHTTIVAGTSIGNNVIIGANSLVCKDIPDNCVAAGNPARVICSLDEYYYKRKSQVVEEAKNLVRTYIHTYGRIPPKEMFYEYFWIFSNNESDLLPGYREMMESKCWTKEEMISNFLEHKTNFSSYDEFIDACKM